MGEIWTYTTPRTPALAEARATGAKRYFTGKPCKHGHVAERITSSRECCGCIPAHNAREQAHPDGRRKRAQAKWHANQPAGYQNTPEHSAICANWRRNNKEAAYLSSRVRVHRRKQATLRLTTEMKQEIREKYREARRLAKETGVPHDVDHIIPLKGKLVSGLHVPWNLRVVPATVNRRKYNFFVEI